MKTTKRRKVVLEYTVEHEALSLGWIVQKWPPLPKQENSFAMVKFVELRRGDVVLSREDADRLRDLAWCLAGDHRRAMLALLRGGR
jgi:hypothetical protein